MRRQMSNYRSKATNVKWSKPEGALNAREQAEAAGEEVEGGGGGGLLR